MISILKAPLVRGFFSFWLLTASIGAAESVDSSQVADPAKSDSAEVHPRYEVGITNPLNPGSNRWQRVPGTDTLEVILNGFGKGIGGFDIKIGIDNPDVHLLEILPGKLIDSCKWKLFSQRKTSNLPTTNLPLEVWQVIGLSQVVPDSSGPRCFGFDSTASLMRLIVHYGPGIGEDVITWIKSNMYLPIFFYWEDCTDNTLSTESGDTLCVSSRVFDRGRREISEKRPSFPSRAGVPRECINASKANRPHRLIDFYNGGIGLKLPHRPVSASDPGLVRIPADTSHRNSDTSVPPK